MPGGPRNPLYNELADGRVQCTKCGKVLSTKRTVRRHASRNCATWWHASRALTKDQKNSRIAQQKREWYDRHQAELVAAANGMLQMNGSTDAAAEPDGAEADEQHDPAASGTSGLTGPDWAQPDAEQGDAESKEEHCGKDAAAVVLPLPATGVERPASFVNGQKEADMQLDDSKTSRATLEQLT